MTFGRITVVSTHEVSASEGTNPMGQVRYPALVEWGRGGRGSKWSCHVISYKMMAFFLVRLRNLPTYFFRRASPKYVIKSGIFGMHQHVIIPVGSVSVTFTRIQMQSN
jgi:hypothetical protein